MLSLQIPPPSFHLKPVEVDHYAADPTFNSPSSMPLNDYLSDSSPSPIDPPYSQPRSYYNPASPELRRMSEPAILSLPNMYGVNHNERYETGMPASHRPPFASLIARGASHGSLRDARTHHMVFPPNSRSPPQSELPESPLVGAYPSIAEDAYESSPPISSALGNPNHSRSPPHHSRDHSDSLYRPDSPSSPNSKTYSFVTLPGNTIKKRPRRRYDEIERLYQCSFPDCNKAYGTLNHLNAHVTMQKHGQKRSPNEFKELRKQWRKAKKDSESGHSPSSPRSSSHFGSMSPMSGALGMLSSSYGTPLPRRASMGNLSGAGDAYGMGYAHNSGNIRYPFPHTAEVSTSGQYGPPQEARYVLRSNDDMRYTHQRHRSDDEEYGSQPSSFEGGWSSYQQQQYRSMPQHQSLQYSPSPSSQPSPMTPGPPSETHPFAFPPELHHSQSHPAIHSLAQFGSLDRRSQSQSPPTNRLGPNSTLLTPLPGYDPSFGRYSHGQSDSY